jgi:hypothetical protein
MLFPLLVKTAAKLLLRPTLPPPLLCSTVRCRRSRPRAPESSLIRGPLYKQRPPLCKQSTPPTPRRPEAQRQAFPPPRPPCWCQPPPTVPWPSRPFHELHLVHVLLADNASSSLRRSSGPSPVSPPPPTLDHVALGSTTLVGHSSSLPQSEFTTRRCRSRSPPHPTSSPACRIRPPLPPSSAVAPTPLFCHGLPAQ